MPQIDTVTPDDYNALRTRVQLLKQQHVEAVQQQQAHREVDLASFASRCAQLEALNASLTADNERLQLQLRQNTERGAKLRRQQEREHQKLREQVEKLTAAAATVDENWADKLAKADSAAVLRIEQLQTEIADLQQKQEAATARLRQEHEEQLRDIDGWCRGEVGAVQHNARAQVTAAHAAVEQWQHKYDEACSAFQKLSDSNTQLLREIEELRDALQVRESEVAAVNAALQRLRQQCAEAQEGHEAELRALQQHCMELLESKRAQHAEQLAQIEGRLQAVVAKKDATIAALRVELQSTYATLQTLKAI